MKGKKGEVAVEETGFDAFLRMHASRARSMFFRLQMGEERLHSSSLRRSIASRPAAASNHHPGRRKSEVQLVLRRADTPTARRVEVANKQQMGRQTDMTQHAFPACAQRLPHFAPPHHTCSKAAPSLVVRSDHCFAGLLSGLRDIFSTSHSIDTKYVSQNTRTYHPCPQPRSLEPQQTPPPPCTSTSTPARPVRPPAAPSLLGFSPGRSDANVRVYCPHALLAPHRSAR